MASFASTIRTRVVVATALIFLICATGIVTPICEADAKLLFAISSSGGDENEEALGGGLQGDPDDGEGFHGDDAFRATKPFSYNLAQDSGTAQQVLYSALQTPVNSAVPVKKLVRPTWSASLTRITTNFWSFMSRGGKR